MSFRLQLSFCNLKPLLLLLSHTGPPGEEGVDLVNMERAGWIFMRRAELDMLLGPTTRKVCLGANSNKVGTSVARIWPHIETFLGRQGETGITHMAAVPVGAQKKSKEYGACSLNPRCLLPPPFSVSLLNGGARSWQPFNGPYSVHTSDAGLSSASMKVRGIPCSIYARRPGASYYWVLFFSFLFFRGTRRYIPSISLLRISLLRGACSTDEQLNKSMGRATSQALPM